MYANPKRLEAARLKANMSRADLAFEIRRITGGEIKATERGIRGWEKGEHGPSDGVVPAIASATGHPIEFFYTSTEDAEDSETLEAALMGAITALVRKAVRDETKAAA